MIILRIYIYIYLGKEVSEIDQGERSSCALQRAYFRMMLSQPIHIQI